MKYDPSDQRTMEADLAKTLGAARFQEPSLARMEFLDAARIVITKHGKPVAKPSPISSESNVPLATRDPSLRRSKRVPLASEPR